MLKNSEAAGYITDVVYSDNYYEQLSPVAINYLAALNGQRPRDLGAFDYCELGCSSAVSLLIHAATQPGGRFVGIDLNPEHIDRARQIADAAGLQNVRLIAEPVSDTLAQSDLPSFDFIVMHGLYSWVSEEVRATIRRFIDARLKPGGLVLVSYNALPGCAARQPLRDIMRRFALPLSNDSLERAQLGLSYLRLMLNAQIPFFALNPELARYAESLFKRNLNYVAHEFFNEHWHPLGVERVAAEMAESGLQFAGTLPLWQNHIEADVPENLRELFSAQTERVTREIHKDFIYNTVFRTDLYIRPAPDDGQRCGRTAALWNMPMCAVAQPDTVQLSVQQGAMQLPLNTRESRIIFALLQEGPRSSAQIATHPRLKDMPPEALVEAICWWVLSGQVRPVSGADVEAAATPQARRLDRALLEAAMRDPDQPKAWLASPRLGAGFAFEKSEALALCARAAAPDAPAAALCELMRQSGLIVEEDGAAIDDASLMQLAQQLYEELEAGGTLGLARRLGLTD